MSGKIDKIELKSRKNTAKSKNILHCFVKVALLRGKSGTFTTQKWHFYQENMALFSPKKRGFRAFFVAHFCWNCRNMLWYNQLSLHAICWIFASVWLYFSKTAPYMRQAFSMCKNYCMFAYIMSSPFECLNFPAPRFSTGRDMPLACVHNALIIK